MSEPSKPRVKLPDMTPPRLTMPGRNSWASSKPEKSIVKTDENAPSLVTNRDKYENKPTPPTPDASPSGQPLTVRRNRANNYVEPATPLVPPAPMNQVIGNPKNRAVTDPVIPQPLTVNKHSAISQLRKKYSQSRMKNKAENQETAEPGQHDEAVPPVVSEKASQILGVYPVKDNKRTVPPMSAPPSTQTPDPFRDSTEGLAYRDINSSRQIHSNPVPTRRYMRENNLYEKTLGSAPPFQFDLDADTQKEEANRNLEESKVLQPTISKTSQLEAFRTVERFGYVNQHEARHVPSFAGLIVEADSKDQNETLEESSGVKIWEDQSSYSQRSVDFLPSAQAPLDPYAGIWENDPHVVRG
ncbi:MAG: hypothetical protein Q9190_005226 [Brigantiaea leucoxantha]